MNLYKTHWYLNTLGINDEITRSATRGPIPHVSVTPFIQSRLHLQMFMFAALNSFENDNAYIMDGSLNWN